MRESDPNRYKRIPGSARRYLDLETGESISRRERDKRVKDTVPELGGDERDGYDGGGYGGGGYDDDGYDDDDDDYYIDIVSAGGSTRD
jgi:hypothetical protein